MTTPPGGDTLRDIETTRAASGTGPGTSRGTSRGRTLAARVVVHRGTFTLDAAVSVGHEVTAVVGPNGAGKSTLLSAIAGTVPADAVVALGDRVLADQHTNLALHERRLGLMFQDPVLLPHLTLVDNVAFAHAGGRRIRAADRRVAYATLARVGIDDDVGDHLPDHVSGGQAQRAALARALVTGPDALLLDEPLAAVDATGRQALRSLLRRQLRDFNGPCIVVTHDLADIATLADRVVVLEDGRITADAPLPELATRPTSDFVADLVGVNLYRGTATGTVVTVANSDGHEVSVTIAEPAHGDVHVAVPPRAVALFATPPSGSPRNTFRGTITRIDPLGDRLHVHLAGDLDLVAEVTPAAASELQLADGSPLHGVVKATEIAVYPR